MMNNPLQLMQAMKNPQAFIQQAMNSQLSQNPIAKNALEMYQRGDINGINTLAENLCREKNIDIQQAKQQIKSKLNIMN